MPDNLTSSKVEELKRIIDGYESTAGIPWPSDWTRVLSALPALLRAWEERESLVTVLDARTKFACEQRNRAETAEREAAKWKANHDEMVARNKTLRDRPDLPVDLARLHDAERERDEARAERDAMKEIADNVVADAKLLYHSADLADEGETAGRHAIRMERDGKERAIAERDAARAECERLNAERDAAMKVVDVVRHRIGCAGIWMIGCSCTDGLHAPLSAAIGEFDASRNALKGTP